MIPIFCEITETCPPEVMKKHYNTLTRNGLMAAAQHWHAEFLPMHFLQSARFRYGYKQRGRKWLKRKRALATIGRAKQGGVVDLVFSGMLAENVLELATFRATATQATVTMRARNFVQMRLKTTKQPDMAGEITRVIPQEAEVLASIANDNVTVGLNRLREIRVLRLK